MGFLRSALHYASLAWTAVFGIAGDIGNALDHVWHFAGSIMTLFSHVVANIVRPLLAGYLGIISDLIDTVDGVSRTMDRIRGWIYLHQIVPLRTFLLNVIVAFAIALNRRISALKTLVLQLYIKSLTFTRQQVGIERQQRIQDVKAARAYALRITNALHSQLENEAAKAYNAHTDDRISVISRVIDEIANRNPALRALISRFVVLLIDFAGTENPALRLLLRLLLPRIISALGVDKVLGDLLSDLFDSFADSPRAKSIPDVIGDLAQRMTAMENQFAQFMHHGGPEVENAGDQWKSITSLGVDVALLAFFGAAVADPGAWAHDVSATVGVAVNDSAAAISRLIRST